MFVPIYDSNNLKTIRFQFVTVALIIANVIVFVFTNVLTQGFQLGSFAVVPIELLSEGFGASNPSDRFDAVPVPERWTLLSYMFLHGNTLHLLGNMLFLWVFGDNVEDAMGHTRFLIFYLACGVAAGLAHTFMNAGSGIPMIGASGATSGVVAAYLILHPKVQVWVLVFKVLPVQISALLALGAWIAMQFVLAFVPQDGANIVAWWAHVGGIIAGAILVIFMRRRGVALFDRNLPA